MSESRFLIGLVASMMVTGCAEQPSDPYKGQQTASFDELTPEEHLRCAALISAYNRLLNSGLAEADHARNSRLLETLMWHHNAYALPKGMKEQDSMQAVNVMREEMLSTNDISSIVLRAKACIDMVE